MLGLKDTSLDAENYQIKLLQTCSIEKRLSLFFSLSNAVLELSQQAIRETKKDKMLAIIKYQYSKTLEEEVKNYLTNFNLIYLGSVLKIDIFIPKSRDYDKEVMQRALSKKLEIDNNILSFYLKSAEDIILTKLEWYRLGGEVSERQISDILGVLRVQADNLDFVYLKKWSVELKVDDLLERVIEEAKRF